jgi:hypothetical protein
MKEVLLFLRKGSKKTSNFSAAPPIEAPRLKEWAGI